MAPMKTVLVTGSAGFMGRNLRQALARQDALDVLCFDVHDDPADLPRLLDRADVVFHLAGVNRPERVEAFAEVNIGLTQQIADHLTRNSRQPSIVMSSSAQAKQDNPYGASKRRAEEVLAAFASRTGAPVRLYRLPGVFGRWSRPNYNSVVATFCHNIARGLPVEISDPAREIALVHVQDVVRAFCAELTSEPAPGVSWGEVSPLFQVTLGRLADLISSFRDSRRTLRAPDMADPFVRRLYSTYLSYLPPDAFAYDLEQRRDGRGSLAELLKSPHFGQIFVSRTRPGITRGNHYHDVKVEKFCVVEGEAVVRFRDVQGGEILEYPVSGADFRVVDIPPGYAHSIENVGDGELVVLFWACEIFDPASPDTYARNVLE